MIARKIIDEFANSRWSRLRFPLASLNEHV